MLRVDSEKAVNTFSTMRHLSVGMELNMRRFQQFSNYEASQGWIGANTEKGVNTFSTMRHLSVGLELTLRKVLTLFQQ